MSQPIILVSLMFIIQLPCRHGKLVRLPEVLLGMQGHRYVINEQHFSNDYGNLSF